MEIAVVVEEVYNIWGYRKMVKVLVEDASYTAAYDQWENCLGGSCRDVERLLERLGSCERLFAEELEDYGDQGRRYRVVYECPDTP